MEQKKRVSDPLFIFLDMESNEQFSFHFLGGIGTVSGSKTLIECNGLRVLIDCGLFQGLKPLRLKNWEDFPVDPTTIDVVILTHAHLDHSGYLPLLVKKGFKGEIHCTESTEELTNIILTDSAKIQEEDAERANRKKYSKHRKAEPLYTREDVKKCMTQFVTHQYNQWVILSNDLKFEMENAGHILGSAILHLKLKGKDVIFSGDIGRQHPLLMYPPKKFDNADYIVLESTYGDRIHEDANVEDELLKVINETWDSKGILMIPSFAVERTQELMYVLYKLRQAGKLPNIPVYLDSPMAMKSTDVYDRYRTLHNIPSDIISQMYDQVHYIETPEESKEICLDNKPKIVLAGSGMIEGGRIVHYLNNHMDNPDNTLLFVGYQGAGTRGRSILEGAKEIKFFGKYHKLNCRVRSIMSLSAHGDQNDLIDWLRNFTNTPTTIFLNHGEPHQSDALRVKIEDEFGWHCEVPQMNDKFTFDL